MYKTSQIDAAGVKSLLWHGDRLIDWVSGGKIFNLDGASEDAKMRYGYRFDAAIASRSGQYIVIYERLGTKGIIVDAASQEIVREIDRSYYQADVYEYPVCFLTLPDQSEAIAHCPRDYCRIDIERVPSGECLTDGVTRKPQDSFYSRLAASPESKWLASAGWVWHPYDVAHLWNVEAVLEDPTLLDDRENGLPTDDEVGAVAFAGDDSILMTKGEESWDEANRDDYLAVFSTQQRSIQQKFVFAKPLGTVFHIQPDLVLGIHEHPKLVRLTDGKIVAEWPDLPTGKQKSSIIHHIEPVPPFAVHPRKPVFAVAQDDTITVVHLKVL
jgi:hypothetical protein